MLIIAGVVVAFIFGARWYQSQPKAVVQSIAIGTVTLPDAKETSFTAPRVYPYQVLTEPDITLVIENLLDKAQVV